MDKVSVTKSEFRLRQWTKIIQDCQASGMPVASWCSQNNVNSKTYYYWLRKIRMKACDMKQLPAGGSEQAIVPLCFEQKPTSVTESVVTIHLSSVSIDIREGTSQTAVETVLKALKSIC